MLVMSFSGFTFAFANGEVLKLNTKGKQYCHGVPPTSFNSKNDIDFWLVINSQTSATLYADEYLYSHVATFSMQMNPISATKFSFSGFSGNSADHITAVGSFSLDKYGYIKSINAVLNRRGVINDCYSNAVVTGKTAPL